MTTITAERLKEAFTFDPKTGAWARKIRMGHSLPGSFQVNPKASDGYGRIKIDGHQYLAHRLAWLYVHGEWPVGEVDHLNGEKCDNRIENLRDVSHLVNSQNRRSASKNSKHGLLGASPFRDRFMATIKIGGRQEFLGYYDTAEHAHEAYVNAKRVFHEGCTI